MIYALFYVLCCNVEWMSRLMPDYLDFYIKNSLDLHSMSFFAILLLFFLKTLIKLHQETKYAIDFQTFRWPPIFIFSYVRFQWRSKFIPLPLNFFYYILHIFTLWFLFIFWHILKIYNFWPVLWWEIKIEAVNSSVTFGFLCFSTMQYVSFN